MTDSSVKDTTESGGGAKRKKKARAGNSRKRSRAGSRGKVASRRARAGLGDEIVRGVERLCQAPEGVQGEEGEPSKRMPPSLPEGYKRC